VKRGRGAGGKIPVFGMLKRGDKVYTQIVPNCSVAVLMPIIEERASKDSVIFTDEISGSVHFMLFFYYLCISHFMFLWKNLFNVLIVVV
jgi:transposase-like protein